MYPLKTNRDMRKLAHFPPIPFVFFHEGFKTGCGSGESKERVACGLLVFTLREATAPDDPRNLGGCVIHCTRLEKCVKHTCCAS